MASTRPRKTWPEQAVEPSAGRLWPAANHQAPPPPSSRVMMLQTATYHQVQPSASTCFRSQGKPHLDCNLRRIPPSHTPCLCCTSDHGIHSPCRESTKTPSRSMLFPFWKRHASFPVHRIPYYFGTVRGDGGGVWLLNLPREGAENPPAKQRRMG